MRRALRLAERGRWLTTPNPQVGAVVVGDGRIVGEGWHEGPGTPHAEVLALRAAGEAARGASLYVTLAPCTTYGRTPPCLPRVLASGVSRVVIGITDPSPREAEGSAGALGSGGVEVILGVLEPEARALIFGFAQWVTTGRPAVTVKIAASVDGRVAAADGSSRWVPGPTARRDAHRLRARADAVMVGVGTVLTDDPALTCRLRGFRGRQPLRVVLDSSARTPVRAIVLDGSAPSLVATTAKAPDEAVEALRAAGAEVARFPARDGRVDLAAVLAELGRRELTELLVEGGPTVVGELVDRRLVDRYVFYVAPKLLGQVGLSAVAGVIAPNIADARELTFTSVQRVGADVKIEAIPRV
jgi:diaminohydroxyphosphoribosylaminopyrimidine deaminase/5-amino-6-(5-phosphoribosylamino)uracil reductase